MLAHCSIIYAHLWLVRISSSLDTALVVLDSIFLVCIVYFPIIFYPRPGINHCQGTLVLFVAYGIQRLNLEAVGTHCFWIGKFCRTF